MLEPTLPSTLADSGILAVGWLKHFVDQYKLHPILVNFTAALIPVSVGSDFLSRLFRRETLRSTGWWTLLYATIITPFTSVAGWLFWMPDDNGVTGMAIHKWLGTSIPVLLLGLFIWRAYIYRRGRWPEASYLIVGFLMVAVVTYQGHLGGNQVFSGP
jgi:uncharacterized membrane protein